MSSVARVVRLAGGAALCGVMALSSAQGASGDAGAHPPMPHSGSVGFDVGELSCSAALPRGGTFGVVGATAGKPFHSSPCLRSELAWATAMTTGPQFYVNLADPGHKSSHWGKGGPRACRRTPKYDVGCAYDYGVQSAKSAVRYVKIAGGSGEGRWWLDVETDNSWGASRAGVAANIADIDGALHYLRHRPHTSVGVYTETTWWQAITGGVRMSHVPVWGGGADSKRHARENCHPHSVTGGPAQLTQWITGTTDHDYAC